MTRINRWGPMLGLSIFLALGLFGCEDSTPLGQDVAQAGDVQEDSREANGDTQVSTGDTGKAKDDAGETKEDSRQDSVDAEWAGLCKGDDSSVVRPNHWTYETHCKGADPNYDLLFNDTVVHRIDITITPENYQATMDDLTSLLSSSGGPPGGGPPGGGPPGPGDLDDTEDPIWVEVTVDFNGHTWEHVAMRYKGNSSLRSAWQSGVKKLAFRLTFDKYEDDYPELMDQRFYGFKKMTFSNGYKDSSLIRDKVAADIFRDGGVVAARGAFARVFVDMGSGPVYFGLYTMIEDPSNRLLDTQFADDSGNMYKPEGDGATFEQFVEDDFEKKTNEDEPDFSDVIATIDALNASRNDAASWRQGLETYFNVTEFLRALAINQIMVNWDSYGCMTHNFYIYGDPDDNGRLRWIPWDLNESLMAGGMPGCNATSIMLDQVGSGWPLIRFLLDDSVYRQMYIDELQAALDGPFAGDKIQTRMEAYHDLIAPYVVGAEGEASPYTFLNSSSSFETSLTSSNSGLIPHVNERVNLVTQEIQ